MRKADLKKFYIIISVVTLLVVAAVVTTVVLFSNKKKKDKAAEAARLEEQKTQEEIEKEERINASTKTIESFMAYINDDNYTAMYGLLDAESKKTVTQDEFTKKNKSFYDAISATDVKVENIQVTDGADKNNTSATYSTAMSTIAGAINFDNSLNLVKENEKWLIKWTSTAIYPELEAGCTVKAEVTEPKRGTIYAKDNKILAENSSTGTGRTYPVANAAAHLVGYVNKISADEIKERGADKYQTSSLVGKKGLEYAFEEKLRGTCGSKVSIIDGTGTEKSVLAEVTAVDGQDLHTSINIDIQNAIYKQIKDENACSVAINPYTGEILAMLSTPAYDNNGITKGTASDTFNRVAKSFCPGSTFKSVTAAVGLDSGAFTADEDFGASTKKWQKDSSWGNFYVTTLHACKVGTLINGLTLSDNVYFAKAALKIGSSDFASGLKKIGFNKSLPIEMNFTASQFSNSDGFSSDGQLANSGYGQGEILVNPLHMASIYSAFLNEGKMVSPCFEYESTKYWIEDAFKADTAETVKNCLINVVESSEGTGHAVYNSNLKLGGKTGTAEIKSSQSDTSGTELGWFIVFTPDKGEKDAVLIVTMIEDVKNRNGSGYVVGKTKNILNEIF